MTTVNHESSAASNQERKRETYSNNLSAVSDTTGGSQFTTAVSFPGSAAFSLDAGHLILGGSISETNRWRLGVKKKTVSKEIPESIQKSGKEERMWSVSKITAVQTLRLLHRWSKSRSASWLWIRGLYYIQKCSFQLCCRNMHPHILIKCKTIAA